MEIASIWNLTPFHIKSGQHLGKINSIYTRGKQNLMNAPMISNSVLPPGLGYSM